MKLSNSSLARVTSAFNGVELGDPRRVERLEQTIRRLARQPQATFPEAMGSEAELEGAYRLINNRRVTMDLLNAAHAENTARQAQRAGKVLARHDTTPCEFKHADPNEVGYLNTGKPGFMAHYTLIVDANGSRRPLGVTNVEPIFRTRPLKKRSKAKEPDKSRPSGAQSIKKPNRESARWWRGFERTAELLQGNEVIHVADREGDNYELFGRSRQRNLRFVIRVRVSERLGQREDGMAGSLRTLVETRKGLMTREVVLSTRKGRTAPAASKAHPPRNARIARLEFSATTVEIKRPAYQDRSLPPTLELNLVRVYEPNHRRMKRLSNGFSSRPSR